MALVSAARAKVFLANTGDDTWDVEGEARGEAALEVAGEASADNIKDSVELELDNVPPLSLLKALMAWPHRCHRLLAKKALSFSVLMMLRLRSLSINQLFKICCHC